MKIEIETSFVKAGVNVNQGDIIKLLDEGEYKIIKVGENQEAKKVLQFQAQLPDGQVKTYTMNVTTQKNLIQEWSKDSKTWMNKPLKVWVVSQMSFGKMIKVLILTPEDWKEPVREEEVTITQEEPKDDIPVVEEENPDDIDVKDIPF